MSSALFSRAVAPLSPVGLSSFVRTYVRAYFYPGTATPTYGHKAHKQQFFSHSTKNYRQLKGNYKHPSEVKRIRSTGWSYMFGSNSRRKILMGRILRGERYIAEY